MAEAGEDQPKRCHCGFWGSPQTMNLCSKCYQDYLQKVKASKAEGGEQSSSRLLEQLGLYPSATSEELSNTSEKKEEPRSEEKQRQEKEEEESGDVFLPVERPIQKNKKRCWTCKTKLELAQRELGGCKCVTLKVYPTGYVFCFQHRLPEQHSCIYDHKEGGRQEALKNMVITNRKKIGRSFHRMDSRPE